MKYLRLAIPLLFAVAAQAQPNCALTTVRCAGTAQEYATLQLAANAAVAGDTVYAAVVENYVGFELKSPHVSGSAGNLITVQMVAGAAITTAGNASGDGINVDSVDYVKIDGVTVTGSLGRTGIKVTLSTGSVISNNVLSGCTTQCILTGFIQNTDILFNTTTNAVQQHGIYVSNSRDGFDRIRVIGNVTHGNALAGIQFNGDCTTLDPSGKTDGMLSGLLVEGNTAYNNGGDGFSIINVSGSTFRNNLLYNNAGGAGGIKLADQGCNLGSNNNAFVNNTVYGTTAAIRIVSGSGNTFWNNLLVSNTFYCVIDATTQPCDNSGSGSTGNNYIAGLERTVSTAASGVFTNVGTLDFTLASGSPAIGAGIATNGSFNSPLVDILNNVRPAAGTWDAGAYERGASPASPDTTAPTAPGTPSATISAYRVDMSWTASTDASGVIGYIVYRDAVPFASVLAPVYSDTTVSPGTTYVYTIYAYDASGNTSTAATKTVTVFGQVGCMNGDTSFRSVLMPIQTTATGTFTFEMDAVPFGTSTTNAVIGLSAAAPTGFSDLAVIVRFPSSGSIDARNGAAYTADISLPYTVGVSYHVRIVVNLVAHTYTVFVTPAGGGELTLATNYAFRVEQASVTQLLYVSVTDDTGSASVCSPAIDGTLIDATVFVSESTQNLVTQAITAVLVDANGTGKPLMERPKSRLLTGSYTLKLSDNAMLLYYAGSGAATITVPTGLGAGFGCTIVQDGSGTVTLAGSGMSLITRSGATHTAGSGSAAVVQCTSANSCKLWGDVQ